MSSQVQHASPGSGTVPEMLGNAFKDMAVWQGPHSGVTPISQPLITVYFRDPKQLGSGINLLAV